MLDVTGTLTVGSFSLSSFTADVIGNLTGNVNATSGLSTFTRFKSNRKILNYKVMLVLEPLQMLIHVFALKINSDPRNRDFCRYIW